jgi:hypothetical protein
MYINAKQDTTLSIHTLMPQRPTPHRTHVTLAGLLVGLSGGVIALQIFLLGNMAEPSVHMGIASRRLPLKPQLASLLMASADMRTSPAQLRGIRIEPDRVGGLEILQSQSVRLTSVGIFATMEQQIAANWSLLLGTSEQALNGCTGTKACSFTPSPGMQMLQVIARSGGFQDTLPVRILSSADNPFSDALPNWASTSILALQRLGVIQGYDDGRYGADDSLLRGQGMILLTRVLTQGGLSTGQNCNTVLQIPATHYAHNATCLFVERGWEPDQWVNPDAVLTRGETAAYINRIFGPALLRAMGSSQGAVLTNGQSFTDVPTDDWYFFDAGVMEITGIMTGNPDGTFSPNTALNRAEAAVIVDRLLQAIERLGIQRL